MKIGLVPMAAKPYHTGHHALVQLAASQNDLVYVYVSTTSRNRKGEFPISGKAMKQIWQEQIEQILPSNVETVYGGSPVRNVYLELEKADGENSEDIYRVYSDPVDTAQNFPEQYRQKNFPNLYANGQVVFVAEENPASVSRGVGTPNIRGRDLRQALKNNDFNSFASSLPAGLDPGRVWEVLGGSNSQNEAALREFVRAFLTG